MQPTRLRTITALALVAAAMAGCGGGDKAGGSGGQVTLRVGTDDTLGRPSAAAIQEFARQAKALSGGRIRIEPVWQAAGGAAPSWDQRVARKVTDGDLDMGMIPARAWDTEGVTTLRALHAPFLVDSDALVAKIATSDLAAGMLRGLGRAGVVGLALVPEDLRHPFAFRKPFVSLRDFAGRTIRTPRSNVAYSLIRRLGAKPDDITGLAFTRGVHDASVAGAESAYALASTLPTIHAIATGNLTLFPKVDTLVVNERAWSKLTAHERATLHRAARRTVDAVLKTRPAEAEAAKQFCRQGGEVVLAKPADVSAVIAAARPVYAELERDPSTRAQIRRIEALKQQVPAGPAPAPCKGPQGGGATPLNAAGPSVLDGIWRANPTYEEGRKAGLSRETAAEEMGVETIRMQGGHYDWRWRARVGAKRCPGTYTIAGNRVVFKDGGDCQAEWEARFSLRGRTLRWSHIGSHQAGDPADLIVRKLIHKPWTKIGTVRSAAAAFPEGVYRTRLSYGFLRRQGLAPAEAHDAAGLQTMTFRAGHWLGQTTDNPANPPDCGGRYAVANRRVTITVDDGPQCGTAAGGVLFSATWTLEDRTLRLAGIRSGEGLDPFVRAAWGSKPWRKIR
jgi:TRAP-type C4-dicarboxylate transport system substrate-binding protein